MRTIVALLVALSALFASRAASAAWVDIYTIGRGNYLWAAYGHTVPCVMESETQGSCYDYAIPDVESDFDMVWGTLRGEKKFTIQRVEFDVMLGAFKAQERRIERQRLPFPDEDVGAIRAALEDAWQRKEHYAYHPGYANCSTKVRDLVDRSTGGKLSNGSMPGRGPTFRVRIEEGLSGRVWPLLGLATGLGGLADRNPTTYEDQFIPNGLRDALATKFGVKPVLVYDREEVTLATSRNAGRFVAVLIGVLLAAAVLHAARRSERRARWAVAVVGLILGLAGAFLDVICATTAWVEFRHNWLLLVALPSDVALAFLGAKRRAQYLAFRLGIILALSLCHLAGLIAQPIVAPVLMIALPLLAVALLPETTREVRRAWHLWRTPSHFA
jgi:hypothetical protein